MGLISLIAGVAMCIYGHMENKDTIAVMENLAEGGGGKPGGTYMMIGAALIVVGLFLLYKSGSKSAGGNDSGNAAN